MKSLAKCAIYLGIFLIIISQYNFLYQTATSHLSKSSPKMENVEKETKETKETKEDLKESFQNFSGFQTTRTPRVGYRASQKTRNVRKTRGALPFGNLRFRL